MSIQEALVYLGVNAVRTVVLGFSLLEQTREDPVRRSIVRLQGVLAARIASRPPAARARLRSGMGPDSADEVFLGALLADVGHDRPVALGR